jgi:uncharacterized protein YjiK
LTEVHSFHVVTGDSTSSRSGLEGLTVNPLNGHIYAANEKGPAMIIQCSAQGEELESKVIKYARDISGLAYDEQLQALWVLSDQDEK